MPPTQFLSHSKFEVFVFVLRTDVSHIYPFLKSPGKIIKKKPVPIVIFRQIML